jgi:GT2 family glycosyltransferase
MSLPLAVVVPAHAPPEQVQTLVAALAEQVAALEPTSPLTVVVVDDWSPQPLAGRLQAEASLRLQVVETEQNGGPGAARNRGLQEVATPWVAFLDADTVPAPGWLVRALELVARPGCADMVEGRTRIPSDRPPTPFTHATEAAPPVQHVAGNVLLRTKVLRSVGGFDERFYDPRRRLHFREDAELAFRLAEAGATDEYVEDLVVDHPPLPSSFWSPVRLARRYTFDPLLDREHPARFRAMNRQRMVGPFTLRRARHDAAVALVLGAVVLLVGLVLGIPAVWAVGAVLLVLGELATCVALCWRKRVRPVDVVLVPLVAPLVAVTYLWHWWRGVLEHRHRPRL